jgi:hypothetical protein
MAESSALQSLIDESLSDLEPLFVLDDETFIKTERSPDGAHFVTALGVVHPLRRLCSIRVLAEQCVRRNATSIGRLVRDGVARLRADCQTDDLIYFMETLAPAFQGRDWSEHFDIDLCPTPAEPKFLRDFSQQIDELSEAFPPIVLPSPSYLVLDSFRMLIADAAAAGVDHVRYNHQILVPTGETVSVGQVNRKWREGVSGFVTQSARRLVAAYSDGAPSPSVSEAREEIARTGHVQRGDLIFLAGPPSRLGHVLPPHYNRVLGRQSDRDLAMMLPLTRPPRITPPEVFARDSQGRWRPFHLPHGLCLGGSPPDIRPESPGLALLAFLRWAACRIAANGAFHANDDQSTEYE